MQTNKTYTINLGNIMLCSICLGSGNWERHHTSKEKKTWGKGYSESNQNMSLIN